MADLRQFPAVAGDRGVGNTGCGLSDGNRDFRNDGSARIRNRAQDGGINGLRINVKRAGNQQ